MQILHSIPVTTALVTDPTWIFSVVLCIILLSPLLLSRLRIPHVIGLILAGVLVGKYGLNILDRDSSFELFGQVGIYYIMFLAGLELDMGSVQQYGRDGIKFGIATINITTHCTLPAVRVPVLSIITVSTEDRFSNAPPSFTRMPCLLRLPAAAMIAVGVARISAQGQKTTSTVTDL